MERDRRELDAARHEMRDQLGAERAGGARHLRAAGVAREDGLVGVDRRSAGANAGTGWDARGGRGTPRRARRARAARPPAGCCRGRAQATPRPRRPAARRRSPAPWRPRGARPAASAVRSSTTQAVPGGAASPPPASTDGARSGSPRRRPGIAAGRVAEVFTTRTSPAFRKSPSSSKQALISAPSLFRDTSSATSSRSTGATSRSSCAAKHSVAWAITAPPARPRSPGSGRSGRSPSIRASRPGTLSSGGGRSEMSSPGKASWCIWVRMSPGSTQYTRRPGCSAAKIAVSCSSAAFDDP